MSDLDHQLDEQAGRNRIRLDKVFDYLVLAHEIQRSRIDETDDSELINAGLRSIHPGDLARDYHRWLLEQGE